MMYNWPDLATVSGKWGGRPFWGMMNGYGYPMMGAWGGGFFAVEAILHLITWIVVLWLLVAIARYFWKKGGK